MKISFECADKINGLLTMTVEPADYQDAVEKTLKNYRKKAQVPGFRPGMVPMGMIKKQYGTAVKVDEVNKVLGEKLYEYIQENRDSNYEVTWSEWLSAYNTQAAA